MWKTISILLISQILIALVQTSSMPQRLIMAKEGERVEIPYYKPKSITRWVQNAKGIEQEHIFRVCNGKNKAKCGFWENVKNKQKVGPATNYNTKKDMLVIPKVRKLDAGTYRTPSYDTVYLTVDSKIR